MNRLLLLCMLASLGTTAHAAGLWESLWHNADQQGDHLLQQGKADVAAQTYRDPRRRAYAELQAGHYADAAKHYADFNDSESNYNRGNALAQAGQLQDALKAYDAALAQDPDNSDARHNRDLVARALQQQQQQHQPAGGNNSEQDGKNGSKQENGQSGKEGSANQNAGQQGSAQDKSAQQNSPGQNTGGQNSSGQQQGDKAQDKNGNGAQQNAQGKPAQQNEGEQSSSAGQSGSSSQNGNASQANDAEQAKRDAAAALGNPSAGKSSAAVDLPASEQQLAQEQWLRRIPDDPGGLLRRKFMIEHMIRHQGRQP